MRVVVVGSGAREHAFGANLAHEHEVLVTPGNPGMVDDVTVTDRDPEQLDPDLVIIGAEALLVDGLADRLRSKGIATLGPGADGAQLEGSKAFLKHLCEEAGVPTAAFGVATSFEQGCDLLDRFGAPYVIKTDGLAAGKGVLVTTDRSRAEEDLRAKLSGAAFGEAGRSVVIEEGMHGREVSVFALCNGRDFVLFPPARDYKRLLDHDQGPNTGGMGSIAPVGDVTQATLDAVASTIIAPTLARLQERGIDYRGILYAGCMLTPTGPRLVEYNVRFGDPEAEVVLPLIAHGLGEALMAAAVGEPFGELQIAAGSATTVVVAAPGYPEAPVSGLVIDGVAAARKLPGVQVYTAGVARDDQGRLVTAGGRVLAITGVGADLAESRARAYAGVANIGGVGLQYRRDIGS